MLILVHGHSSHFEDSIQFRAYLFEIQRFEEYSSIRLMLKFYYVNLWGSSNRQKLQQAALICSLHVHYI